MFNRSYFEKGSYGRQESRIIQRNYYHLLSEAKRVFPEVLNNRYRRYIILDFGCGYGAGTYSLSKYFPNSLVIGVDISSHAIEKARHRYSSRNIVYLTLDLANHRSLKLLRSYTNDEGFDIIFTRDVLEHIPIEKHHLYIKAFTLLLKTNGIVIAQTPNKYDVLAHIVDRTHIGLGAPNYWKTLLIKYFRYVKVYSKQFIPFIWRITEVKRLIEVQLPVIGFNIYIFARGPRKNECS